MVTNLSGTGSQLLIKMLSNEKFKKLLKNAATNYPGNELEQLKEMMYKISFIDYHLNKNKRDGSIKK